MGLPVRPILDRTTGNRQSLCRTLTSRRDLTGTLVDRPKMLLSGLRQMVEVRLAPLPQGTEKLVFAWSS